MKKRIIFSAEGLTLDQLIKLVFFSKTEQFENEYYKVLITTLRKYSALICSIGYTKNSQEEMYVTIRTGDTVKILTKRELNFRELLEATNSL